MGTAQLISIPWYYFTRKILGDANADVIDVYEAMDMALPGIMAYRSVLNGRHSDGGSGSAEERSPRQIQK